MTIEERMYSTHMDSLSYHYRNDASIQFQPAFRDPKDRETIVSKSDKQIYVTRHMMTGEPCSSIIFQGDWFDRFVD
jgi:hypothetical protein